MKNTSEIKAMIAALSKLDTKAMYLNDFFHTWKESDDEIAAVFQVDEERVMCRGHVIPSCHSCARHGRALFTIAQNRRNDNDFARFGRGRP